MTTQDCGNPFRLRHKHRAMVKKIKKMSLNSRLPKRPLLGLDGAGAGASSALVSLVAVLKRFLPVNDRICT